MTTATITLPDGSAMPLGDEKHPDQYVDLFRFLAAYAGRRPDGSYPAGALAATIRDYAPEDIPLLPDAVAAAGALEALAQADPAATVRVDFPPGQLH